jgi:O-antigen/teichoic acid export membrane protein
VAGFSVAYSLGAGVGFVTTGLISALSPWIMRKIAQGKEERVAEVTLKLATLVAVGSLCVLTIAPELIAFLATSGYSAALPSVYPITVTAAVSFVGSVTATALIRAERTASLSLCSIVGAAVNIGANLILLPISFNGAAIAHFAAAVASLAAGIILTRRLSGSSVVKALPTAAVIGGSAILSIILYALREDLVSRLVILALLGLAAITCLLSLKDDVIESKTAVA